MSEDSITRRSMIAAAGVAGLALPVAARAAAGPPPVVDIGTTAAGKVEFPSIAAPSEQPAGSPPNPDPLDARVGFAVVGLGRLAVERILPAFAASKHARVAALVSGTPDKLQALARQYGVPADACYSYEDFARIRDNRGVQAVYVVTPNALHRRDVLAAAAVGKHVLCEKPMAKSAADCRAMIAACKAANVRLMIAYRMQYQPHLREAVRMARGGELCAIRVLDLINTQNQGDPGQWRQRRALAGGGSLPDIGLYCLNTARAILGEEPLAVTATIWSPPGDPRFDEVEDSVAFTLRFPSGAIANCLCNYSTHRLAQLKLMGADAWLEMDSAFDYEGQRLRVARLRDGKDETAERKIAAKDQFALELDHFAECVRAGTTPRTPGEEGLQDNVIMEAIYAAAKSGRSVALPAIARRDPFRGPPLPAE